MKAIIVGCGGQDGRILAEQLSARAEVVSLGRKTSVRIEDASGVTRLVSEFLPDHIYYLAGHHQSSEQPLPDDYDCAVSWEVHVQGFRYFLEACRKFHPAARIFYASSSRVFGQPATNEPQTEETPLKPLCLYGITKAAGMMLADYYRAAGFDVSSGILYNHESPWRGRQFLSQRVAYGLAEIKAGLRKKLEVGDLNARADWGYAPDYTAAMTLILEQKTPGNFIIASGESHSVRDLIEVATECLGLNRPDDFVVENPALLRRDSLPAWGDPARLRALGWKPKVGFKEMVNILCKEACWDLEHRVKPWWMRL